MPAQTDIASNPLDGLSEMGPETEIVKYLVEFGCVDQDNRIVVGPLFIKPVDGKSILSKADTLEGGPPATLPIEFPEGTAMKLIQPQFPILLGNAMKIARLKRSGEIRVKRCLRVDISVSATPGFNSLAILSYMMSNVCKGTFPDQSRPIVNTSGCSSTAFDMLGACVFEFETG